MYDCLSIALAMLLGVPTATADRRLYEALAAGPPGRHIAWIEDLPG